MLFRYIMDTLVMKEDKPTDFNKQLGSSPEINDAVLSSMSRNARLSKGAMNYSDTLEQGAQINNELVILQQFNLVAYLTVMREFEEIRRIYHTDERLSQRLSILLEMEREREAKQQQTQFLYAEQERQRLSKNQEQVNQRAHEQDAKQRQLMNDLAALHQLQQELQVLRETYYARQIVLYDELSTLREEQMDEMLEIARNADNIAPEQLTRLEKIHENHQRRMEQIARMPTTDAEGKYNWNMAQRKLEAHKTLNVDISEQLTVWEKDNRHVKGIHSCFNKHQVKIEEKEKIIAKNERVFKVHEVKLQEKIEAKNNATKVVQQISDCIDLIEKMDKSKLSTQEREMIKSLSKQLENDQNNLSSTQSLKAQQPILASCINNLKKIDNIIKPGSEGLESYEIFKNSINDLERKLDHSDKKLSAAPNKMKAPATPPIPGMDGISISSINNHQDTLNSHGFTHFKSTYKELRSENTVSNEQLNQLKQINEEFKNALADAEIEGEDAEIIKALQENLAKVSSCDDISKLDSESLQEILNPIDNLIDKYNSLEDSLLNIKNLCAKIERSHQHIMTDENTNTNQYRI